MAGLCTFGPILLLVFIVSVNTQQKQLYKICVNEDKASIISNCKVLGKTESLVNCVFVKDSVDCALKIKSGQADFGIFSAEEAILASKFIDDTVQVTNELRSIDYAIEPFAFQTVVVVKSDFNEGIRNLENKNYCHPGFKDSQYWTDWVMKYFESKVVPQTCDSTETAAVNELQGISNFFNSTCRPGAWAHNEYYNNKLKRRFQNLCSLCDNQGEGCSYYNMRSRGDQADALNCLTKQGGDVTYVALQSAKEYFGLLPGFPQYDSPDNYKYLCQNGSMQSLKTQYPCAWVRQPWNSVVAVKSAAEVLKTNLAQWLDPKITTRGSWQESLSKIVLDEKYNLVNVTELFSLTNYITQGREIPKSPASSCKEAIRWCTLPEETEKCKWMGAAALTHGITPEIKCVTGTDQWDCFLKIRDNKADFIGIDSNLGYITRYNYDLSSQMFQETYSEGDYQAVPVIANKQTAPVSQQIKSFTDLNNKKACFSEYGGVAWVSFVEALRKKGILPRACPYGNTLGQFFSGTCSPGSKDPVRDPKGLNTYANLCSLCQGNCNATATNKYYGDAGAMECLVNGADVAFLNGLQLKDLKANLTTEEISKYSILCYDGKIISLNDDIGEKCPLTRVVGGEVIGRRTRSKDQSIDFYLALLEMDDWFGLHNHNSETVFHMYDEFDSKKGLLFKEDTVGLINYYDQQLDIVKDYIDLKGRADQCGAPGTSSSIVIGHITWILASVVAIMSTSQ